MNKVRELQRLFIGVVRDERGLAIVMVSLAMAVLLGMTALVVDVGAMTLHKNRLANACDAAAMAGAWKLPHEGQATAEAINFTGKNGVSSPDVVQVKILNDGGKIEMTASRVVDLTFAKILGKETATVSAKSSAVTGAVTSVNHIAPFCVSDELKFEYGKFYNLKVEPGSSLAPGNFGALALGADDDSQTDSGANAYEDNIINGCDINVGIGDTLTTKTGVMAGKTKNGIETRIAGTPAYTPNSEVPMTSPRVMIIPVYDHQTMDQGKNEITIVGFAAFVIEDYIQSTKEVKGWYLKDASPTGNVTIDPNKDPNADGFGMRGVSLSS